MAYNSVPVPVPVTVTFTVTKTQFTQTTKRRDGNIKTAEFVKLNSVRGSITLNVTYKLGAKPAMVELPNGLGIENLKIEKFLNSNYVKSFFKSGSVEKEFTTWNEFYEAVVPFSDYEEIHKKHKQYARLGSCVVDGE